MFEYLKSLSEKYDTTFENVLSIALNRYGIIIDNFNDNRIRFDLDILNNNHNTFFAVCVNTYEKSPFKYQSMYDKSFELVKKVSELVPEKETKLKGNADYYLEKVGQNHLFV